jgi:peptidoglycan/xylan/chitin deacetylase (PgdA/CDA1 family)
MFAVLFVYSGAYMLLRRLQGPRILVLAYHRVTPAEQLAQCAYPAMHVSVQTFAQQIETVRAHWDVVSLPRLQAVLDGHETLRSSMALVTFDDGYRDNFQHAMPALSRLGCPATFFLSYAFVDAREAFWFDQLASLATAWERPDVDRPALRAGLPPELVQALEAPGSWQARLRRAAAYLKTLADGERRTLLARLAAARPDVTEAPPAEAMSWNEVRHLHRAGMSIGAHGVSHGILTRMPAESAAGEIATSLQQTAGHVGVRVDAFAYPNGDATPAIAAQVRDAGAALAFTMQPRLNRATDDPWLLGRFNVCEDTSRSAFRRFSRAYFLCEISGVFGFLLGRNRRGGNARA